MNEENDVHGVGPDDVNGRRDAVWQLRMLLSPTLYTDESSTTDELLWQQVLEQRAQRGWLVICAVLLCVVIVLGLTVTIVLTAVAS